MSRCSKIHETQMKIRKEKKRKLEENRLMGEDPEYEYEWNNFSIVQVIDLDDDDSGEIEESRVRAEKQEVQYSNLLNELKTNDPIKTPQPDSKITNKTHQKNEHSRPRNPVDVKTPVVKPKDEGTVYYKCHLCFQQIPAKDYNEHYKEELRKKKMREEALQNSKQKNEKDKAVDIKTNLQSYLIDRKAKKKQDNMIFKKKDKPDFLK